MLNMNKLESNHDIFITARKKLQITGINKIVSLNNEEFLIDTKMGLLLIEGNNLVMQQLDIDKGQIWIEGTINSLGYIENDKKKKEKTTFLGKLFK